MPWNEIKNRGDFERPEDRRRALDRLRIVDTKKRHEHLVRHEVPDPKSSFYEHWKQELAAKGVELSEEERKMLLTLVFDFIWGRALQFYEGGNREQGATKEASGDPRVSYIDVPFSDPQDPGTAIFSQFQRGYVVSHVFRLRGRDYTLTRRATVREEDNKERGWGKKLIVTSTIFELGFLLNARKSLFDTQYDISIGGDVQKREGYQQLLVLPTVPEYEQALIS